MEVDDTCFFIEDYVDGIDFAQLIPHYHGKGTAQLSESLKGWLGIEPDTRQYVLPINLAVEIIKAISEALHCAHTQNPSGRSRVLRGGLWGYAPQALRSAVRNGDSPANRDGRNGFRLVLLLP